MKLGLYFLVFGSILGLLFWPKMGLYGVHYFSIWVYINNCEQLPFFCFVLNLVGVEQN